MIADELRLHVSISLSTLPTLGSGYTDRSFVSRGLDEPDGANSIILFVVAFAGGDDIETIPRVKLPTPFLVLVSV